MDQYRPHAAHDLLDIANALYLAKTTPRKKFEVLTDADNTAEPYIGSRRQPTKRLSASALTTPIEVTAAKKP